MKSSVTLSPDVVPVLSRGRHRSPRKGACFMEYASFLAGERWSDRPVCTDGSLAHLARGVNDLVSDSTRARLTVLIPSVIGLVDPGTSMRLLVAVRAGATALPIASESRQRTIAVALQELATAAARTTTGKTATGKTDAALAQSLGSDIRSALALAPAADDWAQAFRATVGALAGGDLDTITRRLTSMSLIGIAEACVSNPDDILVDLLEHTIAECSALVAAERVGEIRLSRTADPAFATV